MGFEKLVERMSVLGGLVEAAADELSMIEDIGASMQGGEGAYAYELDRVRLKLRVLREMYEEACEAV